ncbi:MAG: DUF4982 domain-containing protein [Prevotella sp.]|nr:DUF4982 domain-containing protein [Prevotella sp.]
MKLKLLALALMASLAGMAQVRKEITLSDNWQFSRDRQSWQQVTVPHDWAISGPFDKKWDLQTVAIEQNGETEATEKSGRSGALPWIGEGWYRTTVAVPQGYESAELVFDGAMAEPRVTINGHEAGYWAYGYNAFRIDATPYLQTGKLDIGVHLQNVEESSRWYPGAGIYRPVKLILTGKAHIDDWGIYTQTTKIHQYKNDVAELKVEVPVTNWQPGMAVGIALMGADGKVLTQIAPAPMRDGKAATRIMIPHAKLWSPESPYLYKICATLYAKESKAKANSDIYDDLGEIIDEKTINVGLRTISVSKEHGFQLNGVTRKIKGVCLHHDLGPLGAAVNKGAIIRQAEIMKRMGADAIRTSHNMPSQMQMEVYDSLGMMVMAESFDMWLYPKCKNGYARFFKEWSDRDITNLVLANRNHPSIVMWSIGNEIPEQWSEEGREIARHLQDLCHELDPSRPVTQGMDRAEDALKSGFAQVMDVPGFNYRVHKYADNLRQLPQGFLLGSETASTVSSRGVYKFPVKPDDNSRFASYSPNYDPKAILSADGQCSSYDVEYCPWSNLPDDDWQWQDDCPQVIGEFVWTGFDYLGEPSPYDEYWPARSSYFGICDLAGLPKDRYFLYRSHWNKSEHTIHLLPHWTWPDRLGKVTPVYCYTDYPEAELFLNGKSQGRIRKQNTQHLTPNTQHPTPPLPFGEVGRGLGFLDRYRLRWNDVKYEPGELRVVVYDEQGREAGSQTVRTAGPPSQLKFEAETFDNMVFVTVSMTDRDGNLCPDADDPVEFTVTGAGRFKAVCNGDATSLESFVEPHMRLFHGQLVVYIEKTGTGPIQLTAKSSKATNTVSL